MKKIKRSLAIVLLVGMMFSQGTVQAAEAKLPSGVGYEELAIKIEEFVSEHEATTAGMAVSVFEQDDTIYMNHFGYADKEAGIAVDQDTVIEWGSVSKLLVWVSVMQLWEQGQIDLDRDVREYLPDGFLTNLKFDTPVTMKDLMNHTAGFQEVYADLFIKEHDAIMSLEDSLKAHEPEQIFEPGTVTAYSNWGAALAAYIVERISGESFGDYVHQYIFEPLNMQHSALSADLSDNTWVQEKRKELQSYTIDGTLLPDCFYYITLYPVGMCTSTLADFEAFGKALLNKDSPLFRSEETWETLFTPTAYLGDTDVPSNYHGFFVQAYGVETVGHGGNPAGCSSFLLLDLHNGIGAVVMTNQPEETIYNYEMMELIFGEFSGQDYFGTRQGKLEGIYRPARTIRTGPFKLVSLSFMDEVDPDEFWITEASDGVEKVCSAYIDYVRIPIWQFVLEMALVVLWIVALAFSIISLFVRFIRKIICICGKKKIEIPLGKWSLLAIIMQVAAVAMLTTALVRASGYALASSYIWMFIVIGAIAVFMTGLIVYGIVMIQRVESTVKRKIINWITVIMMAITVVNIMYWNLFMWWKV